jgi:hypothetical protein
MPLAAVIRSLPNNRDSCHDLAWQETFAYHTYGVRLCAAYNKPVEVAGAAQRYREQPEGSATKSKQGQMMTNTWIAA